MKYICLRCGYDAKQKITLERHLNRKNVCDPTDDFISINEVKKYYGFTILEKIKKSEQVKPGFDQVKPGCKQVGTEYFEQVKPGYEQVYHFYEPGYKQAKPGKMISNAIRCYFCGKNFTRTYGLTCHLKVCKKNSDSIYEKQIIQEQQKQILEIKEQHDSKELEIKEQHDSKELEELKKNYCKLEKTIKELLLKQDNSSMSNSHNINNNNNTNNNNCNNDNSMNIHINNYGCENKEYITKDYLIKLLKEPFQAIPRLIEYTHFNKDHPENQNIKLPNKKQPYVKVLKDDKWIYADRKTTILDLIDEKHCELNDSPLVKYVENKFSEHLQDRFERFNERYLNEEKEFTKQLYNETELVMINNS